MAKKKVAFQEIIQAPLLPDEVKAVTALKVPDADLLAAMQRMLDAGIEVSFVVNTKAEGISVFVKDTNPSSVNAGLGFYTNGPDLRTALVATMYKHSLPEGDSWRGFFGGRVNQSAIS